MEGIEKCRQAGKRRRLAWHAFGDDFGGLARVPVTASGRGALMRLV